MPTTVGNEANHNGTEIPEINLGISVLATQYTYENDSFGNDYDKDAEFVEYDWFVEDLDGLKQAFAEGGNIMLMDDVAFDAMDVEQQRK